MIIWSIVLIIWFLVLFLDFAQQGEEKGYIIFKDVVIIFLIIKILTMTI